MRFTLRQMQLFMAIARHGSISQAAIELSMSQSAASTALLELEKRYDRPLFDRAGKRLKINETGRALLPSAHKLVDQAEEIHALLSGLDGPGPLRLGVTQTIGNYVAPSLIEAYSRLHPGCRLTMDISNTADIAAKIANFSLDLALVEGHVSHPDLYFERWLEDELVIIASPTHPLVGMPQCTIEDLLAERWVTRETGSGTRQALDQAMQPYLSDWQVAMELRQIEAIVEMVAISRMISCTSRLSADAPMRQGRIALLDVPAFTLKRIFYIVQHREKYITPGIRAFLDVCNSWKIGSR